MKLLPIRFDAFLYKAKQNISVHNWIAPAAIIMGYIINKHY